MKKRRFNGRFAVIAIAGILSLAAIGYAQDGAGEVGTLDVTVTDEGIEVPNEVEAGFYRLSVTNESSAESTEVEIDRLKEGTTEEAYLEALDALARAFQGEGDQVAAIEELTSLATVVGGESMPPGVFELVPGTHYASMTAVPARATAFEVTAAAGDPAAPEADLVVDMMEFAFDIPDEVPAGEQTWLVQNVGEQIHHMILFRLAEGTSLDEALAFLQEEPADEPPPFEETGYTSVLSPDVANYVTLDLEAGASYLAICFLPDYETGAPHFALGMVAGFTATSE